MSLPLLVFVLAQGVPTFFGSARGAPLWLGLQGLALAWLASRGAEPGALAAAIELALLRGLVAPQLLGRALARGPSSVATQLLPSNLFAWTWAVIVITLGYVFASGVGATMAEIALFGSMAASLLCAIVVLASSEARPVQLVAVLWIENALALFELTLEAPPPFVHVALSAVYVGTVAIFAWCLPRTEGDEPTPAPEVL